MSKYFYHYPQGVHDSISRVLEQWAQVWPDLDVSPVAVIARMARIRAIVDAEQTRVFTAFGITPADFPVLATLRRAPAPHQLTHGQLADELGLTPGSITPRIDHLRKAGLVDRHHDEADGRVRWASLTPRGLEVVNEVIPQHLQMEAGLLSGIDAECRERLAADLAALLASLEAAGAQPEQGQP
jgi:DNA-binding MarR family transcriptional regulator